MLCKAVLKPVLAVGFVVVSAAVFVPLHCAPLGATVVVTGKTPLEMWLDSVRNFFRRL